MKYINPTACVADLSSLGSALALRLLIPEASFGSGCSSIKYNFLSSLNSQESLGVAKKSKLGKYNSNFVLKN